MVAGGLRRVADGRLSALSGHSRLLHKLKQRNAASKRTEGFPGGLADPEAPSKDVEFFYKYSKTGSSVAA